ncbi:MAG: acyl carrier protein [Rickettsiaceae bacterium]|nr:acyl carrier protein [Rickettsiaceae bacterium]
MSDIEAKIIKITAKTLGIDESKMTKDSKFADLGADSLDLVELMMTFEAEFGCDIPDEEATKISTISDAATYIAKQQSAA